MVDYPSSQGLEQKPVLREDTKPTMTSPPQEKPVSQWTIPPKVAAFPGKEGKDADYDLWSFEVNCLQTSGTFEEAVILHQVRKSLQGAASRVVMRLGDKASLKDLLSKLVASSFQKSFWLNFIKPSRGRRSLYWRGHVV